MLFIEKSENSLAKCEALFMEFVDKKLGEPKFKSEDLVDKNDEEVNKLFKESEAEFLGNGFSMRRVAVMGQGFKRTILLGDYEIILWPITGGNPDKTEEGGLLCYYLGENPRIVDMETLLSFLMDLSLASMGE